MSIRFLGTTVSSNARGAMRAVWGAASPPGGGGGPEGPSGHGGGGCGGDGSFPHPPGLVLLVEDKDPLDHLVASWRRRGASRGRRSADV